MVEGLARQQNAVSLHDLKKFKEQERRYEARENRQMDIEDVN